MMQEDQWATSELAMKLSCCGVQFQGRHCGSYWMNGEEKRRRNPTKFSLGGSG